MITLAIQKSGRLCEQTTRLLKECGIFFENDGNFKLKTISRNFPMQILYLRDDDIPECVTDAIADIGIIGENVYVEKKKTLNLIERLGFARCRLSIAVPKEMKYENCTDLEGLRIATSYPNILQGFLIEKSVKADIHEISGSVEISPSIGLSDAIFDIVSTGSTLISNGLKEVETVMYSEAVLVANPGLNRQKQQILDKLLFRIRAVNKARNNKYILLNAPNEAISKICQILPGIKSPTILPLAIDGWSSLHSVICEDDFWKIIENLKDAGAQGILVIPIEKMII